MANILTQNNKVFRSGNSIFITGGTPEPIVDINPEFFGLANNAPISIGLDSSNNKNHLYQTSDTNRPTFLTNIINGLPVINLNGTNNYILFGSAFNPGTIFLVSRATTSSQSTYGSPFHGNSLDYWDGGNSVMWRTDGGNVGGGFVGDNNSKAYINAGLVSKGQITNLNVFRLFRFDVTVSTRTSLFTIGSRYFNNSHSAFYNGQIARLLCFSERLTEIQAKAIENQLLTKYGL